MLLTRIFPPHRLGLPSLLVPVIQTGARLPARLPSSFHSAASIVFLIRNSATPPPALNPSTAPDSAGHGAPSGFAAPSSSCGCTQLGAWHRAWLVAGAQKAFEWEDSQPHRVRLDVFTTEEGRGCGPARWAGPGKTSCHLSASASWAVRRDHLPLPESGTGRCSSGLAGA